MVDLNDLFQQLKRDGLSAKSFDRVKHALNEGGLGQIGDQIRQALGGGQDQSQTAAGGTGSAPSAGGGQDQSFLGDRGRDMFDQAKEMLKKGDKRMVGGIGAALGVLLGGGIKGGIGGALMAILGTSAYNALNKGKSVQDKIAEGQKQELPVGVRLPETPAEAEILENTAILTLRAMIAAAKADGHVDQRERERIMGKLDDADADPATRALIEKELAGSSDMDSLVRDVPDQQTAAQVYAASLLAINVDTPAERTYLRDLSRKLGLDDQVVANLHNVLGAPAVA